MRILRAPLGVAIGALFLSLGGCKSPASPDVPFWVPKDPGTITVRVKDDAGTPVPNVEACVTQPNDIGGVFQVCAWTDTDGARTFDYIPAGQRPVAIKLPAGYTAGSGGLTQTADVTKGKTTTIVFMITRTNP